ncbi:MAG: hypothetical protein EAZ28_25605 [Oscillatoriales cyanobacterium]|nr:MAG: hypothetical protein EAZ28_25605 [Oscillatoriales cyanobacterium]
MNQAPNPFNSNPSDPLDPLEQQPDDRGEELPKLFLILIVVGVVIGGVLSVGVISLMQKAGLTDVPARVQNPK